jgi:hypothetical protein
MYRVHKICFHASLEIRSRNTLKSEVTKFPEGKRPLGRSRSRWEDNIKMDLREIGIDGANRIWLVQDRVRWRAFVNMVMNLPVP